VLGFSASHLDGGVPLNKLGLDEKYEGQTDITGEKYQVEELDDGPRPFTAYLDTGLRRIVEDLGADRATLGALSTSSDVVLATHSWTREGVTPLSRAIRGVAVPWIVSQLRQGKVVALGRLADLPPEAAADRECLTRLGTRSAVIVPLVGILLPVIILLTRGS